MKLIAKATIRKDNCNCGFYHPGDEFEVSDEQGAELISKRLAVEADQAKEEKTTSRTKEDKVATKTK